MHRIIQDELEEYLAGAVDGEKRKLMESHLAECAECSEEVGAMREMSRLFEALRPEIPDTPQMEPGFYARVSRRIEKEHSGSIWSLLFEPVFIRRIAFASLLLLATLGTFLVSQETEFNPSPSAEAVMAEYDSPPAGQAPARDHMLVTLVSYQH
jgi:anti-sigma factor RsiW